MIGWISGTLLDRASDRILINAAGVGYEIYVTPATQGTLGEIGDPATLYVFTHVREDGILLFGFPNAKEKELFQILNSVSGIGPKTAQGILAALPTEALVTAIQTGNTPLLQRTPGIGKKTAERLVTELRDKLKNFALPHRTGAGATRVPALTAEEVISALLNLGYKRPEAEAALGHVNPDLPFDKILRETLKVLAK